MTEITSVGDIYRTMDRKNNRWVRHYFSTPASCVIISSSETLQQYADSINSKLQALISQTNTTSTETAPSSKLLHDTVANLKSSYPGWA